MGRRREARPQLVDGETERFARDLVLDAAGKMQGTERRAVDMAGRTQDGEQMVFY